MHAACGSVGAAAVAALALLIHAAVRGSLSNSGAQALLTVGLPLAALFWGLAVAGSSAVSLQIQITDQLAAIAAAAAPAKPSANGTAAAAATPAATKAAAAKSGSRSAADALLSPPTSPRGPADTPPTAAAKGKRGGGAKAAAAKALAGPPDGTDSDAGGTPKGRGRGAKAAAAAAKEGGKEEGGDVVSPRAKGGKKAGAAAAADQEAVTPKAGGSSKAAANGKPSDAAAAAKPASKGGSSSTGSSTDAAAVALGWLRIASAGFVTLAVALTFLASAGDALWALPGARASLPGLSSLQATTLSLGATTGAAPWLSQLQPAAVARAAGLPASAALLPVFLGSLNGGATWSPIVFSDLERAGNADAKPALLRGLGRGLLGEQLVVAGAGDLGESLWLVRLADQLLEVRLGRSSQVFCMGVVGSWSCIHI